MFSRQRTEKQRLEHKALFIYFAWTMILTTVIGCSLLVFLGVLLG